MTDEQYNILVVDDEPLNLEIITEYLDSPRYRLITAEDGLHACEQIEHAKVDFDLIVLDRMMPRMDGMELLAKVKADKRFADIPVIMQTAAAQKQQIIEGIRQGAYYYLTKPYDKEILLSIVDAALETRSHRKELYKRLSNTQEIFTNLTHASFRFRTLNEARQLASFLAHLCPAPEAAVIGFAELLINAIEHGNLGISYREKGQLNSLGTWADEVERRLNLDEYKHRIATASFERFDNMLVFRIHDQGNGFDWQSYLEMSPDRAFDTHGRGIAMAKMLSFDEIEYQGKGNEVICRIRVSGIDLNY